MTMALVLAACDSSGPVAEGSTDGGGGATASVFASGSGGQGGAGGQGGRGGSGAGGGATGDDASLCAVLAAAGTPAELTAAADPAAAPPLTGSGAVSDVLLPAGAAGFVTVVIPTEHTSFAVYASTAELDLAVGEVSLGEVDSAATCAGAAFRRIEHHTHTPTTFVVTLGATANDHATVFYELL